MDLAQLGFFYFCAAGSCEHFETLDLREDCIDFCGQSKLCTSY